MFQRKERTYERINRADAKATCRQKDRGPIRRQSVLCSHRLLIFLFCKHGVNRNATHRDFGSRYAERFKINPCFLDRYKVMLVMMDQPHRVDIEVGDDYYLTTGETFFRL